MKNLHIISLSGALFIFLFLLIFQSCRRNFSFEEIDKNTNSIELDGIVAAPLVNSTLSLSSLIPDTEQSELWIEVDSDSLIHIKMFYDNYIEYNVTDFFPETPPIIVYPIPANEDITAADRTINTNTVQMDAYNSMMSGDIRFKNPTIKLIFDNSIPLFIDMNINSLSFYDENDVIISQITNIQHTITRSEATETVAVSEFMLDETSAPGMGNIFSNIPSYAEFDIDFAVTTQKPSKDIQGTEGVVVDIEVDLPMEVDMNNLVLGDTINFDWTNELYEKVNEVTFKIDIDNGFPLEAELQIYFADVDGNDNMNTILDSVFVDTPYIISGAVTNSYGDVESSVSTSVSITLTKEKVDALRNGASKKMLITGKLNTSDAPASGGFVNIKSDLEITLKIGAKLNYSESVGK